MKINLLQLRATRANELKTMRLNAKLSQNKLSELAGVRRTTIGDIECGNKGWHIDTELLLIETLKQYLK